MKIAFLFLTIGDLNHEYLWREYFKGNEDKYNIYCHPKDKNNVKSEWLKNYIIDKNVETSWGRTINSILELLGEALKEKKNEFFILLSESCVPIKSFKKFFNFLLNKNISFIKLQEITDYDKKARLINVKNKDNYNLIKHSGNWTLNRHHVKKLLLKKNDTKKFLNVDSQDEFFLSIIYTKDKFKNYEIVNRDWDYTRNFREKLKEVYYNINEIHNNKKILEEYNKLEEAKKIIFDEVSKHPRTYFKVNKSIIQKLIESESFFARKFDINSNILEFKDQLLAS
jgi:hypothetical protein